MARQESQSKLLYYPSPLDVVRKLAAWFRPVDYFVRLADPCVGEGHALHLLASLIQAPKKETWGVELSQPRALKAEKLIDVVLPTSFNFAQWETRSVSLVFNNPPYDWSEQVDARNKRL